MPTSEPHIVDSRHSLVREPTRGSQLLVDGGSTLEFVAQPMVVAARRHGLRTPGPGAGLPRDPDAGQRRVRPRRRARACSPFILLGTSTGTTSLLIGPCTLHLATPLITVVLPTNAGGFTTHRLPLPAHVWLLGTNFGFQAAALQPQAPSGLALSAALRVTVGG